MVKACVIGTHGVGKTTLCHQVVSSFREIGKRAFLVEETVRESPFPVNDQFSEECALWIYHTQIKKELEASKNHECIICDRSAIDSLIYARVKNIYSRNLECLFEAAREWMKTYDSIIYVTYDGYPIAPDGFRSTDTEFQSRVQKEFTYWISSDLNYYPLTYVKTSEIFDKKLNN